MGISLKHYNDFQPKTVLPMPYRNTILHAILCCLISIPTIASSYYKVQLGTFVKKIPFTHFAFSGVNNVYMDTDENNLHRYYLRTTFEKYPTAEKAKDALVNRGFKSAIVIELSEDQVINYLDTKGDNSFSLTIQYGFDKYQLTYSAKKELNRLIESLQAYPDVKVAVIGHTDSKGSASYNVELSKARVRSVKRYLMEKGFSKEQLIVRACGESSPLCENTCKLGKDIPDNQKKNRRVSVFFFNEKGEIIQDYPIEQTVHPVLEREVLKD